jgi:aerobic carbon-monoxide dehydrogenase small subunit
MEKIEMKRIETTIPVELTVNGKKMAAEVAAETRLVDLLRDNFYLTGTKEGCGVGECGACTVLLDGRPVNSCMVLAAQARGREVLTIEGVGGENGELHPLQKAFIQTGAVQCGFCTPGMIMSALALLRRNPEPAEEEIADALAGNLCRCTGYKQIIDAVKLAAKNIKKEKQ